MPFLEKYGRDSGWCNLDLKQSKNGKLYFQLNTWKPKPTEKPNTLTSDGSISTSDIPF